MHTKRNGNRSNKWFFIFQRPFLHFQRQTRCCCALERQSFSQEEEEEEDFTWIRIYVVCIDKSNRGDDTYTYKLQQRSPLVSVFSFLLISLPLLSFVFFFFFFFFISKNDAWRYTHGIPNDGTFYLLFFFFLRYFFLSSQPLACCSLMLSLALLCRENLN